MGIRGQIENIVDNVQNTAKNVGTTASNAFGRFSGTVSTGLSNIWDGGFVGIDANGLETLKDAIKNYIEGIQQTIDGYNSEAIVTGAFAGEIGDACRDFIEAVKKALEEYVNKLLVEVNDVTNAYEKWQQSDQSVASSVSENAQSVVSDAQKFNIG